MGGPFPLAPALAAVAEARDEEDTGRVQRLAARMEVHTRTILKWQEHGVDLWTADRIATRLGVNAVRLWPSWEDDADAAAAATPQQLDFLDLAEAM